MSYQFVMSYWDGVTISETPMTFTPTYCPKPKDCTFEPGMIEAEYFDTSRVYLGSPIYTFSWDYMTLDDAAKIWSAYRKQIFDGKPLVISIPDPDGGWFQTTAYITMPEGEFTNDPIEGFSFIAYNIHEANAVTACKTWQSSVWSNIDAGITYEVGSSDTVVGGSWIF